MGGQWVPHRRVELRLRGQGLCGESRETRGAVRGGVERTRREEEPGI